MTGTESSQFPCSSCGAKLEFAPGTNSLSCPYCGAETVIPQSEEDIQELDYVQMLTSLSDQEEKEEITYLKCGTCAAEINKLAKITAMACPYCGAGIVATAQSKKLLKPKSLLPFKIDAAAARKSYESWIQSLWFVPNALKDAAVITEKLKGMYVPYWTYDTNTISFYTGKRGDDYAVTKTRTVMRDGKNQTETYTTTETRWSSVSGTVYNDFDDVLVLASKSLPQKQAVALEPWDLNQLEPYSDEYLSGFQSESYQVDLPQGFEVAKNMMEGPIRSCIRRHIGGDHQRIHIVKTQYNSVSFKHILLPAWICAYRFQEKVYRFLVNARTGEVQGERPWSWVKIAFVVLLGLAVVGGLIYIV